MFQMIAAIRSAKTIAKPALVPTWRISSTGSNEAEGDGAARRQHAQQIPCARPHDREIRGQRVGVDHRGHGVCCVVEAVHELEPERDEQRHAQKRISHERGGMCVADVADELAGRPCGAAQNHDQQDDIVDFTGRVLQRMNGRCAL
jgi:hypothetical protein